MNIKDISVSCFEKLKKGNFEFNHIDGISIQYDFVPGYSEVLVVCDGKDVYKAVYSESYNTVSDFKKLETRNSQEVR